MTPNSRRLLIILAILTFIGLGGASLKAWASESAAQALEIDDLLILAVDVNGRILSRDLIVFSHTQGILVPLEHFSRVIGFAITTSLDKGQASGYFLDEERSFTLDTQRETAIVQGIVQIFDPKLILVEADDIYVDLSLLARWFPLEFEFDPNRLRLIVHPIEPLPFQKRLERENRARWLQNVQSQSRASPETSLRSLSSFQPLAVSPPRPPIVSRPFSSHRLSFNFRRSANAPPMFEPTYSTNMVGTFLDLDTWVSFALQKDTLRLQNIHLSRESPEPNLLGPLRARYFSIGDVSLPDVTHLSSITTGHGVMVSSHPQYRPWQYGTHVFEGEILPGWDAELYHNNGLIAYHGIDDGTTYTLESPLFYGLNRFRLVLYGPFGQRQERALDKYIDRSIMPPDQSAYRLLVVRSDYGPAVVGTYDQGVGHGLSLHGLLTNLPQPGKQRDLAFQIGFNQSVGNLHVEGHFAFEESNEFMRNIRLDWVRPDSRLSFQRSLVPGDDSFQENSRLTERMSLNGHAILGQLKIGDTPITMSGTFHVKRETSQNTSAFYDTSGTLWVSGRRWLMSHRLSGQIRPNEKPEILSRVWFHRQFDNSRWRTHVEYDFMTAVAREIGSSFSWTSHIGTEYTLRATYRPDDANDSEATLRARRQLGNYHVSAHSTYTGAGEWNLGVSISFGAAPHPQGWHWEVTRPNSIYTGSVFIEAFHHALDEEAGRKRRPLEGVSFYVNNRLHPVRTDMNGNLWLTNLPTYEYIELRVDPRSVSDPFLVPEHEIIQVIPRPGHNLRVDFPFVLTSEIDGTVFLQDGDTRRVAAGIRLHLIDEYGHVLHETVSEYDGFYIIPAVTPGTYTLQPDPDQMERLGLQFETIIINIPADGSWISDVDIPLSSSH